MGRVCDTPDVAAVMRRRPRPPCGDDPVLWNAIQTNRRATEGAWIEDRLIWLVWVGLIALVTSWFAVPRIPGAGRAATGAAPEAFTMPAWNPLVRVIGDRLIMLYDGPAAGQGPAWSSTSPLRHCSAFRAFRAYVLELYGAAVEGVGRGAREPRHLAWPDRNSRSPLGGRSSGAGGMLGPVPSRLGGAP